MIMKKLNTYSTFKNIIIFENDDFIIINKPQHISTLEDRNSPINVLNWARSYFNNAKVCHRLDKNTSGILVIAKNDTFYKYFSMLLETRSVTKIYHALVEGVQNIEELELNNPISTSPGRSKVDFQKGRPSMTLVSTIERYKLHSLLECMPLTGRMHQIRVHLSNYGLPIIGDQHYGGKDLFLSAIKTNYKFSKNKKENPLMGRLALHAAGIHFEIKNGGKMNLRAPYPKDLQAAIQQLKKNKR